MFIVGIDVAKRSHEVCMITSDGQTVQRLFSIRNNCTGYNLMLEKIRKHTNIKSQIVFAMESTAHYWLALFTRLRKDGYHVILLNPIQTSAMRDMFIRKIKTDAKDSFIHHCRADPLRALCRKQCCTGSSAGAEGAVPEPLLSGRHGR